MKYGVQKVIKMINNIKRTLIFISVLMICFSSSMPWALAAGSNVYPDINTYLNKALKASNVPGAAVMIVDEKKTLLTNTYGVCRSIDEPFIIGSISKTFTSTAVMQLVEKGKLDLDAPLSRYLPGSHEGQRITIRQLMNHTSGIDTYMTVDNYSITSNQGEYVYANANYGLLGKVIESVSGMSYRDYLSANIFQPLGMKHTYTSLEEAKKNGLIAGYRNYFGLTVPQELDYPDENSRGWLTIPAGYIISSASDMSRYLQAYLNGGDKTLKPESIENMISGSVPAGENRTYGLGWGILERNGTQIISHGGLVENYACQIFYIPELKIGGIMLMNSNDYLVGNDMLGNMLFNVLDMLTGKTLSENKGMNYTLKHVILDASYLLMVLISVLPLIFIRKQRRRQCSKIKNTIGFAILHVVFPSVLMMLPVILKVPMYVIKLFVPDLFLVIIISAALAYFTGLLKIALKLYYRKREKQPAFVK